MIFSFLFCCCGTDSSEHQQYTSVESLLTRSHDDSSVLSLCVFACGSCRPYTAFKTVDVALRIFFLISRYFRLVVGVKRQ